MSKDSTLKTIITATCLCVVCSVLVSSAAVALKDRQTENKKLDIKKNLLLASGLIKNPKASKEEVLEAFEKVEIKVIDLESGEEATDVDPDNYDQKKASKDPSQNKVIDPSVDTAKIKTRARLAKAYYVKKDGEVSMIVLPVHGKGLWSTMYGFVALAPDTTTIKGLGFYEHGETPGLGGEIDNPRWKASWKGKQALNNDYEPTITVIKGSVNPDSPKADTQIDGLSGATITANGVTGLVHYWLGEDGFGPFLANFRASQNQGAL